MQVFCAPSLIFPNLRTLDSSKSREEVDWALSFMHPGIWQTLIARTDNFKLQAFAEAIPVRMPALTTLQLSGTPKPEYIAPILTIIRALPCLTQLHLPGFQDISPFLTHLGPLGKIRHVSFGNGFVGFPVRGPVRGPASSKGFLPSPPLTTFIVWRL
ncbi:hypothetical protein D9758_008704 [Tetrapyrgos nigripes]|uniref:Uncharacterized protein n=1 Tax=Tetrapyrgos nigripes TaxID=182062 RepID=A0A8H5D4K2_9AGAR|nr:hypothetical protein D9758_008704 [Tetrapyrgos nigripes]